MVERFIDEGHSVYEFVKQAIDVECPQCGGHAALVPWGVEEVELFSPRRLACKSCGFVRDRKSGSMAFYADGRDPCFGLPLWYRAETSRGVIWAYHRDHLDQLRAFISAGLRQRSQDPVWRNRSYFSRLPKWIKDSGSRDLVLTHIGRMSERQ